MIAARMWDAAVTPLSAQQFKDMGIVHVYPSLNKAVAAGCLERIGKRWKRKGNRPIDMRGRK